MMNNNKILTVSYGTFSCTLEGFDDSFDTMKAIAEYFRDLASDDRYFGAEPPQPDAEMLARIAEREVARRVEAREHDGRIMLKAHDEAVAVDTKPTQEPQPVPAATAAVAAASEQPEPEQISEPVQTQEDELAAETIAEEARPAEPETQEMLEAETPADEPTQEQHPMIESDEPVAQEEQPEPSESAEEAELAEPVADDTQDVSSQQEENETLSADEAISPEAPTVAEEDWAEDNEVSHDDPAEGVVAQDTALSAEAFFADSPSFEEVETEIEEDVVEVPDSFDATPAFAEPVDAPKAAAESIAAKLQRIREVVSQQDDTAASAEYDEDEAAGDADTTAVDFLDMPFEEAIGYAENHDSEETPTDTTLSDAAQEIEEALDVDDQIATAAENAADDEEDELSNILSRIEANTYEPEEVDSENLLDADDEPADIDEEVGNLFDADTLDEDVMAVEEAAQSLQDHAEDTEEMQTVHGRVLKVNRADLEAALESGDLEEFDTEDEAILSPEEEADLQRELSAVTGDLEEDTPENATARDNLPSIDEGSSEDLSRLMAEADQQMEEPEGATRRSAFAHLRAAVAARFADKSMGRQETEEETTKEYRNDLAEVVRPRRPVASGSRTERPSDARPAPLKLVAEQRIDAEALRDNGPVMPRRVEATLDSDLDMEGDTGFAEFAQEVGATKLPELLEAAAAYLSFVEGREQFSRPQLMTRVRQADCGEFTREDGLRSFGQLLRSGKIEKIKGGRFAASEAIGFRPDERAAS
ncbi:hypothetical protein [uncultured Roseobacter sp.]|uniref:hypothetical protein n=1 Tax=uncultured Roseobacter sp. TaxID=114847 RepID=UPI002606EA6F|nr:hypothetical protein [uncultured Roseobacter sp.]